MAFSSDQWAVILGGSSGFGLATAQRLAEQGMSLCVVHRDLRAALARIEPEFEKIRGTGAKLITFNADALDAEKRRHKLLVAERAVERHTARELAARLGIAAEEVQEAVDEIFAAGDPHAHAMASPPAYSNKRFLDEDDFLRTIHAMGTSLLGWVQEIFARELFDDDARVFGLTSEGNQLAWKGYAAVAAAKVSLESLARSIATEFGPYGIRANVIQAGITETPALAAIPGSDQMKAQARLRNPLGRLTTPRDVANVIALLSSDEAGWINGEVIRVDGGEHISGVSQ
jgi:NAD(P)-dependent dehydrogenase (short-subunit alcohol dehydrogenase family)